MKRKAVLIELYDGTAEHGGVDHTGLELTNIASALMPTFHVKHFRELFERRFIWSGQSFPRDAIARRRLDRTGSEMLRLLTREQRLVIIIGARTWTSVLRRNVPAWFEMQRRSTSMFWCFPQPAPGGLVLDAPANRQKAARIILSISREIMIARQAETA